jgi:hypothetical protein
MQAQRTHNVGVEDDGYFLSTLAFMNVIGGTMGDATIPPGCTIFFGELCLLLPDGTVVDTITAKTNYPAFFIPVPGSPFNQRFLINLDAESALFGTGKALAVGVIPPINAAGDAVLDLHYSMHFNGEVVDLVCDNYVEAAVDTRRALKAISRQTQDDSCASGFTSHQVQPATIFYESLTTNPGGGGLSSTPMETERNTVEYRQEAFDIFKTRYGLTFNVSDPDAQAILDTDVNPIAAMVPTLAVSEGYTTSQQIYGMDVKGVPGWEGKLPLTNVGIIEDGYFLTASAALSITGGSIGDVILAPSTIITYGELRIVLDDGTQVDTVLVYMDYPASVFPEPGIPNSFRLVVELISESKFFGKGLCLMSTLITVINLAFDSTTNDFRYWMRFPGTVENPKCDNYVGGDDPSTTTAPTPTSGVPGHVIGMSLGSVVGALAIVFMQ